MQLLDADIRIFGKAEKRKSYAVFLLPPLCILDAQTHKHTHSNTHTHTKTHNTLTHHSHTHSKSHINALTYSKCNYCS